MPHSTTWTEQGVIWTFWGNVSGEELVGTSREVCNDPRFATRHYQLVDLMGVERFDVTSDHMIRLAEIDHIAALSNPSVRVAVAARDELIRMLSLYYEAESTDSPWEQQIFDSLTDAQAWADLKAET
ncbi:MAG TPA: hypothetical protein VII75_16260 [Thermoanaerobaculia bacterium]